MCSGCLGSRRCHRWREGPQGHMRQMCLRAHSALCALVIGHALSASGVRCALGVSGIFASCVLSCIGMVSHRKSQARMKVDTSQLGGRSFLVLEFLMAGGASLRWFCRNQYLRNQAPYLESWRTQVYYTSGPRGVNTSSSEPQTKGLQSFYRQTIVSNTSCYRLV